MDRDFLTPIVSVLRHIGINATVGHRKELLVDGRKISGTASHVTRNRQLFHGTLLHRSDIEVLHHALRGDRSVRGKGVASVPSPVVNMSDLLGNDDTTEQFLNHIGSLLLEYYHLEDYTPLTDDEVEHIVAISPKYSNEI